MSILNVENVTHGFGARQILDNASFRLLKGEHIGLVGANGEGKSTFLNIITGKLPPDEGKIEWCRHITTGYLDQYSTLTKGKTIADVLREAFSHFAELEAEMLSLYEKMGDLSDDEMTEAMEKVGEIQDILDYSGYYTIDSKISEYANGLGLGEIGLERDVSELSGGQRKRASIAVELISDPSLFFLDEPTSGLDPEAETNLMHQLKGLSEKKGKTVIVITHTLQNIRIFDKIIFLAPGGKLCFYGTPKQAEEFFQVDNLTDAYEKISKDINGYVKKYNTAKQKGEI